MKFYDISVELSPTTSLYPGNPPYIRKEIRTRDVLSSTLSFSSHFGTHVDAPKHFLWTKSGIDKTSLNSLLGLFKVFEIKTTSQISKEDIHQLAINKGDRILFKTRNSKIIAQKKFDSNFISLSLEAAKFLVKKQILLVGIDYFGIEARGSKNHPVHRALLSKGIAIVEGLNLSSVKSGIYSGAILPLKIKSGDAAPARAVLWND